MRGAGREALPGGLEDLWANFRRPLARRNRSESTVKVYRKSFDAFWRWAIDQGVTNPAAVDHRFLKRLSDHRLTAPRDRQRPGWSVPAQCWVRGIANQQPPGQSVRRVLRARIRWSSRLPLALGFSLGR
jgi:hypothetical protein